MLHMRNKLLCKIMQPRPQGLLSYWDGDEKARLRPNMTKGTGDEVGAVGHPVCSSLKCISVANEKP